jgi:large subunit ribosomal protein L18
MASSARYTVAFRRKREGRTNYARRLGLLQSGKPRLIIRKKVGNISAQIAQYDPDGDKILVSVDARQLEKFGLTVINSNVPVAYLTGLLAAKEAMAHKIKEVVVDLGLQKITDKSKIYALIKGAKEGGLDVHAAQEVLPDADRVNGKHIEKYAALLKSDKDAYARQFSQYLKANVDPTTISQLYAKVKSAISK